MYTEHSQSYKYGGRKYQKNPLPFYDSGTTALLMLTVLLQIGLRC